MFPPSAPAPTRGPSGVVRRRAWSRFTLRFGIALAVTGALTAAAVEGSREYAQRKFDDTTGTIDIGAGVLTPRGSGSQPAQNILIVGSDTREGQDPAFGEPSEVGGQRSDVVMLVHVEPERGQAYLVSIPRDTWVTLDTGRKGRVNEAFARGAEGVIRTVVNNFGIPIHHYLEVDFQGVRDIANAVGGVTVFVFYPARDGLSGLDIPGGCVHLDGDQSLAWVRSRHYESFVGDHWEADPTGDIGRIHRQQDFLRRLARTALQSAGSNPFRANDIATEVLSSLKRDPGFRLQDAFDLAEALRNIDTNGVTMTQIPTELGSVGGASVLFWDPAEVAPVLAPFLDVPAPPAAGEPGGPPATAISPRDVSVRVVNAAGIGGLAGRTRDDLASDGFVIAGIFNAEEFDHDRTEIRYVDGPDGRAKAEAVRTALGVGDLVAVGRLDVDVEVLLGRDADRSGGALVTLHTRLVSRVVAAAAPAPPGPDPTATTIPAPPC
jgi:LCP family protein required for cell wall assembly